MKSGVSKVQLKTGWGIPIAVVLLVLGYASSRFISVPTSKYQAVGWLSVHNYSKAGEFFWFAALTLGIPFVVFLIIRFYRNRIEDVRTFGADQPLRRRAQQNSFTRSIFLIALPLIIYLLHFGALRHGLIDFYHEGERLAPMQEILAGGLPYQDIYVQHGLFANIYGPKLAALLFSPTVEGLRQFERFFDPLIFVALYFFGLQLFAGRWIFPLSLVAICGGYNFWMGSRYLLTITAATFLLHLISTNYERRRSAFLGGLFSGLAFFQSTEAGCYIILASFAFFSIKLVICEKLLRWRIISTLSVYTSGLSIVFLLFSVWFIKMGVFKAFLENTFVQCFYQLDIWGLAFPSLSTLAVTWRQRLSWGEFLTSAAGRGYFCLLVFFVAGAILAERIAIKRTRNDYFTQHLLFLYLLATVAFRTALGRSDSGHMIDGAVFVWPLLLLLTEHFITTLPRTIHRPSGIRFAAISTGLLSISLVGCYISIVHQPLRSVTGKIFDVHKRITSAPKFNEPVSGAGLLEIPTAQATQIAAVVSYIQQQTLKDEKIYDFSNQGAYYFFARRRNAVRYHQAVYSATDQLQNEVVSKLKEERVPLIIFKTGVGYDVPDGVPMEERLPIVAKHITSSYSVGTKIGGTIILLRNIDGK